MCSVASEAFGAARTLSDPIQHAKSEEVDCRPSEPLDTLISSVLANQRCVWEGRNTVCAHFLCTSFRHFLFLCFEYWHKTSRYCARQEKLICVCLVMPRCMLSMQLFLSEIVKMRFDRK